MSDLRITPQHDKAAGFLRSKLFDALDSFATLEQRISGLPTPKKEGDAADAGEDFTVVFKKRKSTPVQFDGSGSVDPDSPTGQVASYEWHIAGELVGIGATPIVELEVGVYTATLTVTDDDGAQDTDDVIVTVTKNGSGGDKPGGNDKPCNPNSPKCVGN